MRGIYGICEPGAPLHHSDLGAMCTAMGADGALPGICGSYGAMLAASSGLSAVSRIDGYGIYLAVDADLTNRTELEFQHESVYGTGPASLIDLLAGLYVRHDKDCVQKLEGAFALAIWDPEKRRLLLAVDRHSFKILYWSLEDGRLLFASRLSAIETLRQQNEVNPAAVMQFLVHTVVPAPLTIYKGVHRLEAGTQVSYERGEICKRRYWDMKYDESSTSGMQQLSEELRECMRQAVHAHLDGCHPDRTGAYLSGGTDSSSVLGFASEWHSPFNSFSIYFENRRYDEIGFARAADGHFHAQYHEKCLQGGDAAEAVPKIVEYYEEPFANSSVIGAYYCARLARETGVDTLLAGDGGDELFAGNERYATEKKFGMYSSIPGVIREGVIKRAITYMPKAGPLSLPARYVRRAEVCNPRRMFSYNYFMTQDGIDALDQDFAVRANAVDAIDLAQAHYDAAPSARSELNRLLYLDVKMALADNDLRKVVGTAELAGVRVRFPLLDSRLAELSGRIPSHFKLKGFTKRYIFKQAMKHILPSRILYKKKHGFGVPVGYWILNNPKMRVIAGLLDEPETQQRGYFRPEFISRLRELNRAHPAYFGEVLWLVLMLELWHRRRRVRTGNEGSWRVGAELAS